MGRRWGGGQWCSFGERSSCLAPCVTQASGGWHCTDVYRSIHIHPPARPPHPRSPSLWTSCCASSTLAACPRRTPTSSTAAARRWARCWRALSRAARCSRAASGWRRSWLSTSRARWVGGAAAGGGRGAGGGLAVLRRWCRCLSCLSPPRPAPSVQPTNQTKPTNQPTNPPTNQPPFFPQVFLEDAGFDWKVLGPDVTDLDYVAWQCDQDAYACSGQKCSAQSMLFAHRWAAAGSGLQLHHCAPITHTNPTLSPNPTPTPTPTPAATGSTPASSRSSRRAPRPASWPT
jgi:hypothetical protein